MSVTTRSVIARSTTTPSMTTRRQVLAGMAAAGAALGLGASPLRAAPRKLRLGHPHPESDNWHKVSLRFAEMVRERSGGELEIQVFANGVLGSDPTMINAVRGGSLDIALTGNPFFTGLAPKLNVLDLPFLFNDRKHVAAVLDGEIGDEMRAELGQSGLVALSTWEVGWRNLTNSRRPVRTPADLAGLKIRTTPNPAHVKAFQLLGAVPTPMAFTELFTALEMRSVDGQENPVTLILNAKFYEVQKHVSLTRHAFTTAPLITNKASFEAMDEKNREILSLAARECAVLLRTANEETEATALAALKQEGMEAVEDPDRAAFAAIVMEPVRKDYVEKFGSALLDRIVAAA